MPVIPFKPVPKDWNKEEQEVLKQFYKFRIGRARSCQYTTGLSEDKSPYFTLFVEKTGEIMMHICRGPNGNGYLVMGPSRKTTFVLTTTELLSGYANLDGEYLIKLFSQK